MFAHHSFGAKENKLETYEDFRPGVIVVMSTSAGTGLTKVLQSRTQNSLTWKIGFTCSLKVPVNPLLPPLEWENCPNWEGELETGKNIYRLPKGQLTKGQSWNFKVKKVITYPRPRTENLTAECKHNGKKTIGTSIGLLVANQV